MPETPTFTNSPIRPYMNRITYPNKFLDLGQTFFPVDVRELIRMCRIFYYQFPTIRNIVDKMSEYPISDLIMKIGDSDTVKPEDAKEKYRELLDDHLHIKKVLLELGINYFVNGNNIITLYQDFKRQFECEVCHETFDGAIPESYQVRMVAKKIQITTKCPKCSTLRAPLKVRDVSIKSISAISIIFWNPLEVDIEYNPWSGRKRFLYNVPKQMKYKLLSLSGAKDKRFLLELPKIYFDAIEKDQAIELDAYHMGTPALAQDLRGLNVPVVVSVLKDVWYYQTMRKAQESILTEHIVPFRAIFPQPTGTLDPFTMMRMDKWKSFVKEQVEMWKRDPNHIMITPVPVGTASVGGDAKFLMTTNELRLTEETIIQGFGAPLELIKGGVSWSGTSISLRILENHFISHRKDLELILNNFILPKIAAMTGLPKATVRFSRLRMGDDQQSKQLYLQLVEAGMLSQETYLDELGFDSEDEKTRIMNEAKWVNSLKEVQGSGAAKVQGLQGIVLAKYKLKAAEESMYEEALIKFNQQTAAQGASSPSNIKDLAIQFLNLKSEDERKQFLEQIKEKYGPEIVANVVKYLQILSEQELKNNDEREKGDPKKDAKVSVTGHKIEKPERTTDRVKASKKTQ